MHDNQETSSLEWTSCPQCGQLAEVVDRDVWPSTDGPVEHLHVRCVDRHRFVLPASSLAQHHDGERELVPPAWPLRADFSAERR